MPFVIGTNNYCQNYNDFRYNLIKAVNTNLKELTEKHSIGNDQYLDVLYHINAIFRIMSQYDSRYNKPDLQGYNSGSSSGSSSSSSMSGSSGSSMSGSSGSSMSGSSGSSMSGSSGSSMSGSSGSSSNMSGNSGSSSMSSGSSVTKNTNTIFKHTYVNCLDAFHKTNNHLNRYYNIDPDFKHVNNSFNTFCFQENLNNYGNGWTLNGFLINNPSKFKNYMNEYKHNLNSHSYSNFSNIILPYYNDNVFVNENQITSYNQVLEIVVDKSNRLHYFYNSSVNNDEINEIYHQYAINDSIRRSNKLFDRTYCSYNNNKINSCANVEKNVMSQKINIDSSGDILANTNELGFSKNIISDWLFKYLLFR